MSALNEADFGSDTDDDDYVPEGEQHEASEEENSGDDENNDTESNAKGKKKKKGKKIAKGRQNIFAGEEEKVDWQKELAEEKRELNEEKEKQKADDLFAAFKRDTSTSKHVPPKKSSISSLFDSAPSVNTLKTSTDSKNNSIKPSNRLASLFDMTPNSIETANTSSDSLPATKNKPKSLLSGLFDEKPVSNGCDSYEEKKSESESDSKTKNGKIEITKVFDFAGEAVTVSKQVDADSSEAKKFLKSQEEKPEEQQQSNKRPGGLAGIVGAIGKKQKMGVLDKSKLDWNSFVSEEGISEDLKTHNKGKDGYVEKQLFLERADYRQFEIEKSIRDKNRKSLMK